jgi:hypothetical protein
MSRLAPDGAHGFYCDYHHASSYDGYAIKLPPSRKEVGRLLLDCMEWLCCGSNYRHRINALYPCSRMALAKKVPKTYLSSK